MNQTIFDDLKQITDRFNLEITQIFERHGRPHLGSIQANVGSKSDIIVLAAAIVSRPDRGVPSAREIESMDLYRRITVMDLIVGNRLDGRPRP